MSTPNDSASGAAWWVKVGGKAYGPYRLDQMRRFLAEGRLRASSVVAQSADGPWQAAYSFTDLTGAAGARTISRAKAETGEPANILVFAELHASTPAQFLAALEEAGLFVEIAPGLWLARTRWTAGMLRNALARTLSQGDRFVVLDASRDRIAWHNLGPETEVRLRDLWNKPLAQAPSR